VIGECEAAVQKLAVMLDLASLFSEYFLTG